MLTGETLKAIRAIKGITQAQLALDAEMSAAGIAEFETGKRDIRASTIVRMCEAMGVTVTCRVNGVDIVVAPEVNKTPPRVLKSPKG